MSAKSMFYRIFRIPQTPDTDTWLVELNDARTYTDPAGDAASIPLPIRQADPGEINQMTDTTIIPPIVDDHTDMVAYHLERAVNDVDFTCRAATVLRTGTWQDALAGLIRYTNLHPTVVLDPVTG
jgi:hypothetical protein